MTARKHEPGGFKRQLDDLFVELQATHQRSLLGAALILQGEIRRTLSTPGTGRLYKSRGVTRKLARKGTKARAKQLHQASAPGQPPAVDTGELRRSVVLNPLPDGRVRVGPAASYAAPLEYGSLHVAPRPFMQRSLEAAADAMTAHVVSELQSVVKGRAT